jgi:protocatechuate 3,4-dioxygenase alpha subunit
MMRDEAHTPRPGPTAHHTIGPFFPIQFTVAEHADLTEGSTVPGRRLVLAGRVTDAEGEPIENALVELWQADAMGRFPTRTEEAGAEDDHVCRGWGRVATDADGWYRFRTIEPGSYSVPEVPGWIRPPHFRIRILASGVMRPLVTQVFMPGEPLNEADRQLLAIEDTELRSRLIARRDGSASEEGAPPVYRFDVKLGGPDETPFFELPRPAGGRERV